MARNNTIRNLVNGAFPDLTEGGHFWGDYSTAASLPNVAADAADVEVGDLACVGGVLRTCRVATSGSAVWEEVGGGAGAAWVWPAYTPDGSALTALGTSVTVSASTVLHYTDITISTRKTCTGVGLLMGTTITTGNVKISLFDEDGTLLVSTASTDVTGLTADVFNQIAWTATQTLAPGRYFVGVALDNTTDEIQCLDATHPIAICDAEGGHVYATPDDITAIATTFTADECPIFYLY